MERIPNRVGQGRVRASRRLLARASDEQLTQEMRQGSETAFEVAYGRHAAGMLALCRHMLGSQDDAEEALQHSFAAAWADLQRPDRPAPVVLKPWLYAVARHRCLSMLRSRRPSTLELNELPSTTGLSDEISRRADLRALLADLHDLPEEQRTALVLSELAGLSHADIADVLGRQTSGIKSLVFQARTTLGDWREAREAPCAEIREQLSVLRGGALRRRGLRRHLQACTSCQEFRAELEAQRRRLAIVLPVLPSLGLKGGVLATVGLGGATGGSAAGGSVVGGGAVGGGAAVGLGAPALVPLGSAAVATVAVMGALATGSLTSDESKRGREQRRPVAQAPSRDFAGRGDRFGRALSRSWTSRPALRDTADGNAAPPDGSLEGGQPYPDPRPSVGGDPGTGGNSGPGPEPEATGQEGSAQSTGPAEPSKRTKDNQEAQEKTAKANEDAEEKTAKTNEDAEEKIARSRQERDEKIAKAQLERDEQNAKARQERDEKIAQAMRKAEET